VEIVEILVGFFYQILLYINQNIKLHEIFVSEFSLCKLPFLLKEKFLFLNRETIITAKASAHFSKP